MSELEMICAKIRENCQAQKIILYGIKHHPNTNAGKDVNLCVVVKDAPKEAEAKLYKSIDCDFSFNLLVYSQNDFDTLCLDPTSYAHSIDAKGTVLYG